MYLVVVEFENIVKKGCDDILFMFMMFKNVDIMMYL